MPRFLPATLLFLAIAATAPAVGLVRDALFDAFPESGLRYLVLAFAAAGTGLLLYALWRIRTHRGRRYGGLVLVLGLLWLQGVGFGTGSARVDVVEKVHLFEYGLFAVLLYRAMRRSRRGEETGDLGLLLLVVLWVTLAGAAEEGVQWAAPRRVGEIRDVALNALAGLTGLVFALSLFPPARFTWRLTPPRQRLVARTAAAAVLVLGLFVYGVHLGYEIEDPEIGRFRSRFSAERLRELADERRAAWSVDPPTGLGTWGMEDYFLTEAAYHANHRNASYDAGLHTLAWLANRVLEKYYDPFLDIESFRGSGRHRYPPEVRSDLESKKGAHDPAAYRSPVQVERIHPWPRLPFLTGLAAVVLAVWTLPSWLAAVRAGSIRDGPPGRGCAGAPPPPGRRGSGPGR